MKRLKLLSMCGALLLAGLLTSCHTMNGAGKDLQAGGKALSAAAKKDGG